jgi:hypothetical protein
MKNPLDVCERNFFMGKFYYALKIKQKKILDAS